MGMADAAGIGHEVGHDPPCAVRAAHQIGRVALQQGWVGDGARAGRLLMPCTVTGDNGEAEARWLLSAYDEVYARYEGAWLFRSLQVTENFYAPHLKGWA